MKTLNNNELKEIAKQIRRIVVKMSHDAPSSHVACSLSCVDILVCLYFNKIDQNKDRFILSKGHGCMAQYAILSELDFFPKKWISTYSKNGSPLPEHPPAHGVPGIEVATGSLGHGLGISLGAALARKISNIQGYEFVLIGDGECNEGSIWESAMIASQMKLSNLIAIVDNNKMQAAGFEDPTPLEDKWRSFGWYVQSIDGNNIEQILDSLNLATINNNLPNIIIANTIKGKGVSFMENNLLWHYRAPNDEELILALKELL